MAADMHITVVVQKALHFEGSPRPIGTRLQLPPLKAGLVLLSGRAALADESDRAAVNAALQREAADFIARDRSTYRGSLGGG